MDFKVVSKCSDISNKLDSIEVKHTNFLSNNPQYKSILSNSKNQVGNLSNNSIDIATKHLQNLNFDFMNSCMGDKTIAAEFKNGFNTLCKGVKSISDGTYLKNLISDIDSLLNASEDMLESYFGKLESTILNTIDDLIGLDDAMEVFKATQKSISQGLGMVGGLLNCGEDLLESTNQVSHLTAGTNPQLDQALISVKHAKSVVPNSNDPKRATEVFNEAKMKLTAEGDYDHKISSSTDRMDSILNKYNI